VWLAYNLFLFYFVRLCVLLCDPLWFNDLFFTTKDSKVYYESQYQTSFIRHNGGSVFPELRVERIWRGRDKKHNGIMNGSWKNLILDFWLNT
jgi:hypothetical protein